MTTETLLPLFPLEVVIFPGTKIPLHIFEPRYRLMIGEAIKGYSAFGIILVRDQKIAPEGCAAVVERVTKKHEDGRLDIDARGRKRFKTLELDDSLPYLQARVEYFEDHARAAVNKTVLAKVLQHADRLAALLGVSERNAIDPTLTEPSFHVAHGLPLELDFKQALLTKRSEAERLADLAEHLPRLIERVQTASRMKKLAVSNGKGWTAQ